MNRKYWPVILLLAFMAQSCSKKDSSLFTALSEQESGVHFSNYLQENDTVNYFEYKYMYQGGGVAIGDINNDGLNDLYFTGNMVKNKLYLNKGELKFDDVTQLAGVAGDDRWVTGVTMADVNADGLLDIYVSVAGRWKTKKNLLYINKTKDPEHPTFIESAEEFGVADQGNSVQSVFFDYDNDGDLDLYVANYPITDSNTGILNYAEYMHYAHHIISDHLYRNDGHKFTDVTVESGLVRFGLSLGISVADYNQDGWLDIYVSNDFASPDYFFINQGDGTFLDKLKKSFGHTSFYGMGIDAADINNDGLMDIMQVDMTPEDNYRSKVNMASMNTPSFHAMVANGMHYQYMKNTLQLNRGILENQEPIFSEISQFSGVSLTDWSWGPLIADFDNDGLKDLFITNGSRREVNHKDFYKKMNEDPDRQRHYLDWIHKMPEQKVRNFAYRNQDGISFEQSAAEWGVDFEGWSTGAAYADLDNDGDLDLVVNNIDDPSIVYRNNLRDVKQGNNFIRIKLKGNTRNPFGIGAKVTIRTSSGIQFQEVSLTRGFQSSIESILHFGLGANEEVESIKVVWPHDGKEQILKNVAANQLLEIDHKNSNTLSKKIAAIPASKPFFEEVSDTLGISYSHRENKFDDYAHQVLLPHKMSQFGPALTVGDVNNDGLDDFYIGGSKGYPGVIFTQKKSGIFTQLKNPTLEKDKAHEDVDAVFFDADNDGYLDLYVVSGGNEAKAHSDFYRDRLYLNTGDGHFIKASYALPKMLESGGVVAPCDFDDDGDVDLFIGSRLMPRSYPLSGKSYLLENVSTKSNPKFVDVTANRLEGNGKLGMVTNAIWEDIDTNGTKDLVVSGEWRPISIFLNNGQTLTNATQKFGLEGHMGWWNTLIAEDFDQDGDLDLIGGNLGLNYKYKASPEEPFKVYVNDYDKNNRQDIVLAYMQDGEEYPLRGKQCSSEQIPAISSKFKNYESFAKASLQEVYSTKHLEESLQLVTTNFSNAYFENTGSAFRMTQLPKVAQFSSINQLVSLDFNEDKKLDLFAAGNLYHSEVETPRNDASYGVLMKGNGKGGFEPKSIKETGIVLKGEVRKIRTIKLFNDKKALLVARNDEKLLIYAY